MIQAKRPKISAENDVKTILHLTECKRNVAARFLLLLHMCKSFAYWHFPEMPIPLKSRNHSNFFAPNKSRFLFKPIIFEYLCKLSDSHNMAYSQSTI